MTFKPLYSSKTNLNSLTDTQSANSLCQHFHCMFSKIVIRTFHAEESKQQTDQQTRQWDLLVSKNKHKCQAEGQKRDLQLLSIQCVHVLMCDCVSFVKVVQKCGHVRKIEGSMMCVCSRDPKILHPLPSDNLLAISGVSPCNSIHFHLGQPS